MEYSSSSSSSSSSDDDEATFAALTSTVNVFTRAAQFVLDRIDAEEAECMELDALDDSSSSDDEDESTWGGSPVIFLDIDGVLNRINHATHIRLDQDLVDRLRCLVNKTDAVIVLTTFWRHFQEYIAYILDRHGIAVERTIGATPVYNKSMVGRTATDDKEYTSRAEEIRAWLKRNCKNPDRRFVIFDDRPSAADDTPYLQDRLVQCQTSQGLTEQDVEKAMTILKGGEVEPASAT